VIRRTFFLSTVVGDRGWSHDMFMLKIASRWQSVNQWKSTMTATSSEDSERNRLHLREMNIASCSIYTLVFVCCQMQTPLGCSGKSIHISTAACQPWHIVTLCLILCLRNTLTYLLTSHGPQSDGSSEAEASTPVKGGWGCGSHGRGRGSGRGLGRGRAKLSDETVSSRAAHVSTEQCRGQGWGERSQRRSHIIDETVLDDRSVISLLNWHFN